MADQSSVLDERVWAQTPTAIFIHICSFLFPEKRPWHDTYRVPGHDPKTATWDQCLELLRTEIAASKVRKEKVYGHKWRSTYKASLLVPSSGDIIQNLSLEITLKNGDINRKGSFRELLAKTGFSMHLDIGGYRIEDPPNTLHPVYDYMVYPKGERTWKITRMDMAHPIPLISLNYVAVQVIIMYDPEVIGELVVVFEEVFLEGFTRRLMMEWPVLANFSKTTGLIANGILHGPTHDDYWQRKSFIYYGKKYPLPPNLKVVVE